MNDQSIFTESVSVYEHKTDVEHVLLRPGVYLGDISLTSRKTTIYDKDKLINTEVMHPPALAQLFLEAIGNAGDNVLRSREHSLDPKSIDVIMHSDMIRVKNYGRSIPVSTNEQGYLIPYLIFGVLRSGSNYHDDEEKKSCLIGTNGMGIKLANIFSKEFIVIIVDQQRKLKCTIVWKNNMSIMCEPVIEVCNEIGSVEVIFYPDFQRFGMNGYDETSLKIYQAISIMISFTCQIPVHFNDKTFKVTSITEYAKLFFDSKTNNMIHFSEEDPKTKIWYELCLVDTPNKSETLSYVNGMITADGGVHVDEAYREITQKIIQILDKTIDGVKITKRDVIDHVSVFLNCRIPKPSYKSQTKEYLTKPAPKINLPEALIKKIRKWQLIEEIYKIIQTKQNKELKKTDGKKNAKIHDGNVVEANWVTTKNRFLTVAMVVEGKSAMGYPKALISYLQHGNDKYGICPIQGKILNILEVDFKRALESKQILRLKQFLGLEDNTDYELDINLKKIKYGTIAIMADADDDGIHITGLLIVFFYKRFIGLIKRGRVVIWMTPIIRAHKGQYKKIFYTRKSFEDWKKTTDGYNEWEIKEFKGLGSSTSEEIKEDSQHIKYVTLIYDEKAEENINLAFRESLSNDRKKWLYEWLHSEIFNIEPYDCLPISTYILNVMPYFMIESINRAIPCGYDGLKESQRKGIFGGNIILKEKKTDARIGSLVGKILEITNYKHGESSLMSSIVKMSQTFVGSNNLPYFKAKGQFGSRKENGKDSSNPRYLSVAKTWWSKLIFREEDVPLLERIFDDGIQKEYKTYYPILPMHLVNGCRGIAMAFATKIPQHNPLDLAFWYQQKILQQLEPEKNHILPFVRPWYKGFRGKILLTNNKYVTAGNFYHTEDSIVIDEIPIGKSAVAVELHLQYLVETGLIDDFKMYDCEDNHKFILYGWKCETPPTLQKLKLLTQNSYNNMTVIFPDNTERFTIKTFNNLNDILNDFYEIRVQIYRNRLNYQIATIEKEIPKILEKINFIKDVNDGKIIIANRIDTELEQEVTKLGYDTKLLDKIKTRDYTINKINILSEQIKQKQLELECLRQTKPEKVWYDELENFIVQYSKYENVIRSNHETCPPPSPKELSDLSGLKNTLMTNTIEEIEEIEEMEYDDTEENPLNVENS